MRDIRARVFGQDGVDIVVDHGLLLLADPGFELPPDTETRVFAMFDDPENRFVPIKDGELTHAVCLYPGCGDLTYTFGMQTVGDRVFVYSDFT